VGRIYLLIALLVLSGVPNSARAGLKLSLETEQSEISCAHRLIVGPSCENATHFVDFESVEKTSIVVTSRPRVRVKAPLLVRIALKPLSLLTFLKMGGKKTSTWKPGPDTGHYKLRIYKESEQRVIIKIDALQIAGVKKPTEPNFVEIPALRTAIDANRVDDNDPTLFKDHEFIEALTVEGIFIEGSWTSFVNGQPFLIQLDEESLEKLRVNTETKMKEIFRTMMSETSNRVEAVSGRMTLDTQIDFLTPYQIHGTIKEPILEESQTHTKTSINLTIWDE